MPVKYTVNLTQEEHQQLIDLTKKGKTSARVVKRAQILLLADQGYQDEAIASILMVGESTVHRTRQRYVEEGVELALSERPRKGREKKLSPQAEAFLIATACSTPSDGRESWTMKLLADKLVSLELIDRISDETVRITLKKTKSNLG
jgi:transposase